MNEENPVDPNESMSLSDHESTFIKQESPAPEAPEPEPVSEPVSEPGETEQARLDRERDEQGRFAKEKKHRAKSQHATAADVPRIAELTKKWRETEERAAKAEAKALELERQLKTPKVEPPKEFADAEPKYEDFANEPDQYQAHLRALTAYDRKKEAADAQKQTYEQTQQAERDARNKQRDEWFKERITAHGARMEQFHQTRPDAQDIIDKADVFLNPVMLAAVISAENSPELMLRLAQDSELVDDLHVLTDDKAPSQDLVAYVQRRMNRGLKVGTTGSTASLPVVTAPPRPPNPVRTGVMKNADAPPGEDASLYDHERAYGTGRRRR